MSNWEKYWSGLKLAGDGGSGKERLYSRYPCTGFRRGCDAACGPPGSPNSLSLPMYYLCHKHPFAPMVLEVRF